MTVKSFELGEKISSWKIGIHNSHTIKFIEGCYQVIAGVSDRLQMARGNKTSDAY